jgi:hypothetical protein
MSSLAPLALAVAALFFFWHSPLPLPMALCYCRSLAEVQNVKYEEEDACTLALRL